LTDILFVSLHYGTTEGMPDWDYMSDIVPDGKCDMADYLAVSLNYGAHGEYSMDLTDPDVFVMFIFADGWYVVRAVDAGGFVDIEEGAVAWKVFKLCVIGVLVTFWN